jgi:hypothetical protein
MFTWWESPLGHELALLLNRLLVVLHQAAIDSPPNGIGQNSTDHADKKAQERASYLPQTPPVNVSENKPKSAEEKI